MIVLDILHIIFEILPELILGAGPFCVFKGMGTGKDSGKLLFKKIYSDGGLSITEDGTSLDLSATSPSQAIPNRRIAFGNSSATGLTSSTFCVRGFSNLDSERSTGCDSGIFGLSIIGGVNNCNKGGISVTDVNAFVQNALRTNLIISGSGSYISRNNRCTIIIGGISNEICDLTKSGSIISGKNNYLEETCYSTILSSYLSNIKYCRGSVIISGSNSSIYKQNESFLFGCDSKLCGGVLSYNNSSLIGINSCIENSSLTTLIGYGASVTASSYITLLGRNSAISDSQRSSILNGTGNIIRSTLSSTILNGYNNCIGIEGVNTLLQNNKVRFSTIFNGYQNCIYQIFDPPNSTRANLGKSLGVIINGKYNVAYVTNGINNSGFVMTGQNNESTFGVALGGEYVRSFSPYTTIFGPRQQLEEYGSLVGGCFNTTFTTDSSSAITGKTCNTNQGLGKYNVIIGSRIPNTKILSTDISTQLGDGNSETGCSNTIIQLYTDPISSLNQNPNMITGTTFSLNYCLDLDGSLSLTFNNNVIISDGSSMSSTATGIFNNNSQKTVGRQKCLENSNIIGGSKHLMMASLNSSILAGCCNYISQAWESAIISGSYNKIDGFRYADSQNSSGRKTTKGSVILGGCLNSICKGEDYIVIAGGCRNEVRMDSSPSNFLIADCIEITDKLSTYNLTTQTCTPGLSGVKNTITNLCVCNGIIVSWT